MRSCDETKPYIFISYSHRDTEKVLQIIERLEAEGYNVWYDEGIDPGTEWDNNIANHIIGCSYFIGFVSKNYIGSDNCRDEVNYSRDKKKPQLLVYFEDVEIPEGMQMRMNRIQAVMWHKYSDEETAFSKLFGAEGISVAKCSEADEEEVAKLIEEEKEREAERKAKENSAKNTKNKKPFPWLIVAPVAFVLLVIIAFVAGLSSKGKSGSKTDRDIANGMSFLYASEEKDYTPEKAYEYFEKAAEKGDDLAVLLKGYCLVSAYPDAKKDFQKGVEYLDSVKENVPWAYMLLAYVYNSEYNTMHDTEKRDEYIKLFFDSVDLEKCGDDESVCNGLYFYLTGLAYFMGEGNDERNVTEAIKWLTKSYNTEFIQAYNALGNCYYNGDGIINDSDPDKALEYYNKGAEYNLPVALANAGWIYYNSFDTRESDYEKAEKYFEKAKKLGSAQACYYLGLIEENGKIRTADLQKAYDYYSEGAKIGHKGCIRKLGDYCYYTSYRDVMAQDLSKAYDYYLDAAKRGDSTSMYMLGAFAYNATLGGEPDYKVAYDWFMKASDLGHANAGNYVGIILQDGLAGDADIAEAVRTFTAAADKGNKYAMYNLGSIYQNVEEYRNLDKAVEWYEKAGAAGHAGAFYKLGDIYYYGEKADTAKAKEYYLKSAEMGYSDSMNMLGYLCLSEGDYDTSLEWYDKALKNCSDEETWEKGVAINGKGLNYEALGKEIYLIVNTYEEAAQYGNANAMANLGKLYLNTETIKDYDKAFQYLSDAADRNQSSAMKMLGDMYYNGQVGSKADYLMAKEWYEKAIDAGSQAAIGALYDVGYKYLTDYSLGNNCLEVAFACFKKTADAGFISGMNAVGVCYYNGYGVEKDEDMAVKYYEMAAQEGDGYAMRNIGEIYWKKGDSNTDKAIAWYKKAVVAKNPNVSAMMTLAEIYETGDRVQADLELAIEYYKMAAEEGDSEAVEHLKALGVYSEE